MNNILIREVIFELLHKEQREGKEEKKGRFQGGNEPLPWGPKESDMTEQLNNRNEPLALDQGGELPAN